MIEKMAVQQLFDQLRRDGIDPEQELTWNYYFNDLFSYDGMSVGTKSGAPFKTK